MRSLQAGLDEYVDGEGAVVGAQGFGDGQASEFQYLIRDVRLFAVAGFGWRFRFSRRLTFDTVERWQLDGLSFNAIWWLIAVSGVPSASVYL
jgi:hypothetical protein